MKYTINILGYEYKLSLIEPSKWDDDDIGGEIDYRNRTIRVEIQRWSDNDEYFAHETNKVIWHEIGHAIEKAMPTSINETERYAVLAEELFKLKDTINTITNNANTKLSTSHMKPKGGKE